MALDCAVWVRPRALQTSAATNHGALLISTTRMLWPPQRRLQAHQAAIPPPEESGSPLLCRTPHRSGSPPPKRPPPRCPLRPPLSSPSGKGAIKAAVDDDYEFSQQDARSITTLIPFQNAFVIRNGFGGMKNAGSRLRLPSERCWPLTSLPLKKRSRPPPQADRRFPGRLHLPGHPWCWTCRSSAGSCCG